ncbi:hypothetical protein Tco_0986981, partial [Tanacetum coccineum]
MLGCSNVTIFVPIGNLGKLPFPRGHLSLTNITTVIEQLMAWSGMDMKMAKTCYHSHFILVPYSSSDSDSPDEMSSPEHISPLPVISPFLCTDSSDGPPSQDPYVATVARSRSRVTTHPSSSSEFPIAPVTTPSGIRRWSMILIRPGEAI